MSRSTLPARPGRERFSFLTVRYDGKQFLFSGKHAVSIALADVFVKLTQSLVVWKRVQSCQGLSGFCEQPPGNRDGSGSCSTLFLSSLCFVWA